MPKPIPSHDPHHVEGATIVYLQDWLTMVLTLTRTLLVKYSISYRWSRNLEMQLVSVLHQMEERLALLSSLVPSDLKPTDDETIQSLPPYITSWKQLTLDDELCSGLPSPTDWYVQWNEPKKPKKRA